MTLMHKSAFRDALCLRYGWLPTCLADTCPCGKKFTVDHALVCPTGGYPTIRHNEVHDLIASLLSDVCHDIEVELKLQPLSGESLPQRSNSTEDETRLDVSACGFWDVVFKKLFMT